MDLTLTEEQLSFQKLAREFLDNEVVPHRAEWDRRESVDTSIIPRLGEIGCFGLTEPDTGSDAGSLKTRATRDADDWVINGSKIFITNGTWADVCLLFARTGGPGPKGISAFAVPTDTPGFERTEIKGKLGLRGQATAELTFSDMRVPASTLVGEEGAGFRYAMESLDKGRVSVAAGCVGISQGCLEAVVDTPPRAPSSASSSPSSR